ncbi:MAG: hypothetical protein KGR26_07265, partial [Cyanobacteria bacterium REEB65]|nr:hypothetical protein [Cyanobacteria bacterium REEB65]
SMLTGPLTRGPKTAPLVPTAPPPSRAKGKSKAKISRKEIYLAVAFLFVVDLVLSYMFFIDGRLSLIGKTQKEMVTAQSDEGKLAAAAAQQVLAKKRAAHDHSLPPFFKASGFDSPSIVVESYLDQLVAAAQVNLESVHVTRNGGDPPLEIYEADLTVRGPYDAISAFIDSLASPSYVVGLQQLSVQTANTNNGDLQASLTLNCEFKP